MGYSSRASHPNDPGDPEAPSVRIFLHKKWQLKDGKHPEESAEVGLESGLGKSEGVAGQIRTALEGLHRPDMLEAPRRKWLGV